MEVDGELLYETFTSEGSTLRLATAEQREAAKGAGGGSGQSADAAEGFAEPAAADSREGFVGPAAADPPHDLEPSEVAPYRDLPRFSLWYPYAELKVTGDGELRLPVGAGFRATSVLQKHGLSGTLAIDPVARQPVVDLAYSWSPRAMSLGYAFSYDFEDKSARFVQSNANRVSLSLLPSYRQGAAGTVWSDFTADATLRTERTSGEPFSVSEVTAAGLETTRELQLGAATSITYAKRHPAAALYGGFRSTAALETRYTPPLLDHDYHKVDVLPALGTNLRLGSTQHVLGIRARGAFSSSGSISGLVLPRGGVNWESADGDGKLMASLDYSIPIAVTDLARSGVGLSRLGTSFTVESAAYFDDDYDGDGVAKLEDSFFVSATLDGLVRFLSTSFDIGAGAAIRIDRSFSEPPDGDDLALLLTLNSRLGGGAEELPTGLEPEFDGFLRTEGVSSH
jgi:hypothetical protein